MTVLTRKVSTTSSQNIRISYLGSGSGWHGRPRTPTSTFSASLSTQTTPNIPYSNAQIYHYLKRFHETLEQQIAKRNYTHPTVFDTPVDYLTRIEQLTLRVEYREGRLHGMKVPIDTTTSYRLFGPTGQSMYVLLTNDMLLISPYGPAGILFHSSLAAGEPVACAGDITVHDGQLKAFNRHAPHYQPTPSQLQNLITHFRNHGVDLTDVEITGL